MKSARLLALDLGGVCVSICPDRLVTGVAGLLAAGKLPLEMQSVLRREIERAHAAFAGNNGGYQQKSGNPTGIAELCGALERGEIETGDFLGALEKMVGGALSQEELLALWNTQIGDPIDSTLKTTEKLLAAGWRVAFFSNTSRAHLLEVERKCPICKIVTEGVYSFEAGALKPDLAIYRYFEERMGCKPDYFFDDRRENVEGAIAAGWNAVRYTAPEDLERLLSE